MADVQQERWEPRGLTKGHREQKIEPPIADVYCATNKKSSLVIDIQPDVDTFT
jgi:hypothetical protein